MSSRPNYHFEYGETHRLRRRNADRRRRALPAGEVAVPVSATLERALKLGMTYHYRVVATNSAGTPEARPDLHDRASGADRRDVRDRGQRRRSNPERRSTRSATTPPTTSSTAPNTARQPAGCTERPGSPGTDIGAGETDQCRSRDAQGLRPGHDLPLPRDRDNSLGTSRRHRTHVHHAAAPNSPALADDRAWEMVTPPDKGGAPSKHSPVKAG